MALSPDEQVHIQYGENSKEYYEIALTDGNVLTMTSATNRSGPITSGSAPAARIGKSRCRCPTACWTAWRFPPPTRTSACAAGGDGQHLPLLQRRRRELWQSVRGQRPDFEQQKRGHHGTAVGSYDGFAITSNVKRARVPCRTPKRRRKDIGRHLQQRRRGSLLCGGLTQRPEKRERAGPCCFPWARRFSFFGPLALCFACGFPWAPPVVY